MSKKITILAFDRKKLSLVKFSSFPKASIKIVNEWQWTNDSLLEVLQEVKKSFSGNELRVLVADDLSYSLDLEIEKKLDNERGAVAKIISEEIPELLENEDWDYRVNSTEEDKKQITAFALVQNFWKILKTASDELNLEIEAIESISLAQRRNENPLLSLAMKDDIKGKDEDVLNLELHHKEKINFFKYVIGFIVIFLLVFSFLIFSNSLKKEKLDSIEKETISINEDVVKETTEIEEIPEPIDLSEYSLLILNGSGLSGEGSYVAEILEAEGFVIEDIGNAENYDYEKTEVFLLESMSSEIFDNIERSLNDEYEVIMASNSGINSSTSATIIVGKKISN